MVPVRQQRNAAVFFAMLCLACVGYMSLESPTMPSDIMPVARHREDSSAQITRAIEVAKDMPLKRTSNRRTTTSPLEMTTESSNTREEAQPQKLKQVVKSEVIAVKIETSLKGKGSPSADKTAKKPQIGGQVQTSPDTTVTLGVSSQAELLPNSGSWQKELKHIPEKPPSEGDHVSKKVYNKFFNLTKFDCQHDFGSENAKTDLSKGVCPSKVNELISITSTQLTKDPLDLRGGWGLMYFVQIHKLVPLELMRLPIVACGIGSTTADTLHVNWVDKVSVSRRQRPLQYERLKTFRWVVMSARTSLLPYVSATIWCPLAQQNDKRLNLDGLKPSVDTTVTWDDSAKQFVFGQPLVSAVQQTLPVGARPWLHLHAMACGVSCKVYSDHPITLPARKEISPVATVVAVAYNSTPMLPYYLDYYKRNFGLTHHTIYYIDGWEYAPNGPKSLPAGYDVTLIPWNFKLRTYYYGQILAHVDAVFRHRGSHRVMFNFDFDELIDWHDNSTSLVDYFHNTATKSNACWHFVRKNTKRDCDHGGDALTPDTIRGEDMIRIVHDYFKPGKVAYNPLYTREVSPHSCHAQRGYEGIHLELENAHVAHVARGEPNAKTCTPEGEDFVHPLQHIHKVQDEARQALERLAEQVHQ
eukprot:m.264454 g.264454  ORF g.264454 m.264454 type:complete len:641 (-) comp15613_c0_seq1:173-2095(-)